MKLIGAGNAFAANAPLEIFDHRLRRLYTEIGLNQHCLNVIPRLIVNVAAAQHLGNATEKRLPCFRHAAAKNAQWTILRWVLKGGGDSANDRLALYLSGGS